MYFSAAKAIHDVHAFPPAAHDVPPTIVFDATTCRRQTEKSRERMRQGGFPQLLLASNIIPPTTQCLRDGTPSLRVLEGHGPRKTNRESLPGCRCGPGTVGARLLRCHSRRDQETAPLLPLLLHHLQRHDHLAPRKKRNSTSSISRRIVPCCDTMLVMVKNLTASLNDFTLRERLVAEGVDVVITTTV